MPLSNLFRTGLLLAALTGLLVGVGGLLGGTGGALFAFVIAAAMNLGAWWFSDQIALRMSGAQPVSAAEAPELHQMVEALAGRAGIPKPGVYLIPSPQPNAFATGRSPEKGAVAVTAGLMQMMNRDELAGVIAHELAHIKNRDTLITSIAATIAGAITTLASMAQWALIFGGMGRSSDEEGGNAFGGILMIFLAPIAATLLQLAVSRSREYVADADGARIAGDSLPLASALEKLHYAAARIPVNVNPASAPLYIVNPLHGGLAGLFSTHPSAEERIARLRAMRSQVLAGA
jgi:heat shock protein HtpX